MIDCLPQPAEKAAAKGGSDSFGRTRFAQSGLAIISRPRAGISNSPSAMRLYASSLLLELLVVAPLIVAMADWSSPIEPVVITVRPVDFLTQPASVRP